MHSNQYLFNAMNRFNRGFTMIELMITLAIMAILTTLAVPSFRQTIASSRLSAATNEVLAALNQAKSEAIRSGSRVTICASTNGTTCLTAAGTNWANGWIIFHDRTRSSALPVVDTGDTIFQTQQNLNEQLRIYVKGGSNPPSVSFAPDGTAKTIQGALFTGDVRVCSQSTALTDDTRARDIEVQRSGRIEILKATGVTTTC